LCESSPRNTIVMNSKALFAYLILCLLLFNSHAQNCVPLKLKLDGFKFDSLRIATKDTTNKLVVFHGKTSDQINWTFEVPSEVWSRLDRIVFGNANEKRKVRKYEYVKLQYQNSEKEKPALSYTISDVPCFVPDWDSITVQANYLNSDTIQVHEDNVELIYHNFKTLPGKFTSMEAWTRCPDFSLFSDSIKSNSSYSYNSNLTAYRELVKEFPDSRLLMIKLYENINKYHSVTDATSVFSFFSFKNQHTFIGKEITKDLSLDWTTFDNVNLMNALNHRKEPIINDLSKVALISFTASWCVYCKQEILLLKQIYTELKNANFEMVYIDLDNKSSIESFKQQMIRDSIPWRVLNAYPLQDELYKKYASSGIPVNLLLFPDKQIEYIDVRDKSTLNKLIERVKNYK
jgi:thiol-disulfide isomerase/thioredoxin